MTTGTSARETPDLADLIEKLGEAEFHAGTSEAIDATSLLLALGETGDRNLEKARARSRLRPIFCKSADQQRRFDAIFDAWWDARAGETRTDPASRPSAPHAATSPTPIAPRRRVNSVWLAGVLMTLVVTSVVYYNTREAHPAVPAPGPGTPLVTPQATGTITGGKPSTPARQGSTPTVDRFVPGRRYNVEIRPWWVWALGALPAAALLTIGVPMLVLGRTRLRRRSEPMYLDPRKLAQEARRLVPALQADITDRLARHVRSRGIDIERQARRPSPDLRRTLEATLRNQGIPTLQFSVSRVHPSYLLLIDVASEKDPRGRLFYQWAERLKREGLDVDLRLLRQMGGDAKDALRTCDALDAERGKPEWQPLRKLAEPPFGQRLIVISDGRLFVDESGRWRPDAERTRFYRWPDRAVFTPVEPRDWDLREDSLERTERANDAGFIVMPLEESALASWIDLVLTGQLSDVTLADPQRFPALLRRNRKAFEKPEAPPLEDVESLMHQLHLYLGDRGLLWLAALATTPIVRWELTLLIGNAVLGRLPKLGDPRSLNASLARNYRRLVRLPWLQLESMPEWLRLRLMVELSQAQQAEYRELVRDILSGLSPTPMTNGIELGFERPPGSDELQRGTATAPKSTGDAGDTIYLGYMSGLTPEQLVLRAPREWGSWARRMPLRREQGWRSLLSRAWARATAEWARWTWAGGLPHLGFNRWRLAAIGLLFAPLVIALGMAPRFTPQVPLLPANRFFEERAHERVIPVPGVLAVAFSADDGSRVVTIDKQGDSRTWDSMSGRHVGPPLATGRGHSTGVSAAAWSLDGKVLAFFSQGQLGVNTGGQLSMWSRPIGRDSTVAMDRHGSRIAALDGAVNILLFAIGTDEPIAVFANDNGTRKLAVSPDGFRVAAAGDNGSVVIWYDKSSVDSRFQRTVSVRGHNGTVTSVAFSADGNWLVTGGEDQTVRLWDSSTGLEIALLKGHTGPVTFVAFSDDGARVISGSADKTIRLWDPQTGTAVGPPLEGHTDAVVDIAISHDGQHMASASLDGTVRLWDATPAMRVRATPGEAGAPIWSAAISPDGRRVVAGGNEGLRMMDAATMKPLGQPLLDSRRRVDAVAFTPDGRRFASGGDELNVWDTQAATRVLGPLIGHTDHIEAVEFSPDGRRLASSSASEVMIWNSQTGSLVATLSTDLGAQFARNATAFAFSPDGRMLAAGRADGKLHLWDAASGRPIGSPLTSPSGRQYGVWNIAFSADGTRLFLGCGTAGIEQWDLTKSVPIGPSTSISDQFVSSIALSPDGNRLVIAAPAEGISVLNGHTLTPVGSTARTDPYVSQVLFRRGAIFDSGQYFAVARGGADPPYGVEIWRLDPEAVAPARDVTLVQTRTLRIVESLTGWRPVYWLGGAALALFAFGLTSRVSRITRLVAASRS